MFGLYPIFNITNDKYLDMNPYKIGEILCLDFFPLQCY
ncbi:hypothetical protein SShM2_165 [Synechococcus phage S-ShM2]|uniref:Uncharacterized protein n=1 Tax=Synechococcus phage S-ShM2 TaxID=445683 RepID=E3SJI6_9CAUD|nr:hypothetical protein SShM2_165 [Synechococcus phage S-ShM2]ADO97776.1 hypothetical protein SShM2_165 [Synechococcus phage S-ShM2]